MSNRTDQQPPNAADATPATDRALTALIAAVANATRIVAFTGAGISTESGIPDYRGPGGVWERQAPPTIGDFLENPQTRREYWEGRRTRYPELAAAKPNAGHLALAALERAGRLSHVITQNIDGLHQAAGSSPDRVIELHGTAHRIRCLSCGTEWPAAVIQARLAESEGELRCEICGGPLRAATVLFGEALPREALDRAIDAARACDLMLVVGSSLIVNPAAQLPVLAKRSGARLAIVNRMPTPLDALADVHLIGEAGPVLTAVSAGVIESVRG
ncbi:MAG TPA: Sir2 family NAD-dependent protein deacetylase [Thermomicrobiales bacterium]|nr:Sir2 family NAD-dependent protein deacetylase [Thermomicrobiales bacterium]